MDSSQLSSLLPSGMLPADWLARLQAEQLRRQSRNRMLTYRPYAKQLAFHAAGLGHRERLLRAGNQLGKTYAGAVEAAYHLTGLYPEWWPGRRWDRPTRGWAAGEDGQSVRDTVAKLLLGPPEERGTGAIPGDLILDVTPARGVRDAVDTALVKHVSGGVSRVKFKSYDQARRRWQGDTLDWVWFDEEPAEDLYLEGLSRTNATGGMTWLTFTPLLGMSTVVMRFLQEKHVDRSDTVMTIEDVGHISEAEKVKIIASYPAHEREARTRGEPVLGSGRIFPIERARIECPALAIPRHWGVIGGIDFGWDHPTAAVRLAHDPDSDTIYVTHAWRGSQHTPAMVVPALRPWNGGPVPLPWAWPADGLQTEKGSGKALADQYRDQGLLMLGEHATFEGDLGVSVEAGVIEMLDRMQTGRWKVFDHLNEWFEEFGLYHRSKGKIVKERDDLLDASRYAMMMLRFARHGFPLGAVVQHQVAEFNPTAGW